MNSAIIRLAYIWNKEQKKKKIKLNKGFNEIKKKKKGFPLWIKGELGFYYSWKNAIFFLYKYVLTQLSFVFVLFGQEESDRVA